jgi:hypothetical protein
MQNALGWRSEIDARFSLLSAPILCAGEPVSAALCYALRYQALHFSSLLSASLRYRAAALLPAASLPVAPKL